MDYSFHPHADKEVDEGFALWIKLKAQKRVDFVQGSLESNGDE